MRVFDAIRILLSPSIRQQKADEAKQVSDSIRTATKEHAREVMLLKEALNTGPKLKLIVEPRRGRDGRFAPYAHKSH